MFGLFPDLCAIFFRRRGFFLVEKAAEGIEPSTPSLRMMCSTTELYSHLRILVIPKCSIRFVAIPILSVLVQEGHVKLTRVGFEPTPPKRLRPERSALDRSAISPYAKWRLYGHMFCYASNSVSLKWQQTFSRLYSSVVEHIIRNDGVEGSIPSAAFFLKTDGFQTGIGTVLYRGSPSNIEM